MRLASLKHGRDGRLVVVSADRRRMVSAESVASTLQDALDDWATAVPKLSALQTELDSEDGGQPFDEAACASPLPRAYHWADGSAYVNHVELVRKARGADLPESFWKDPLMYQGGSDAFLAPYEDVPVIDTDWGVDFEAEIAVITDDVPMGTPPATADTHIKLIMLVNDWSLRNLIPGELAKGFGFYQSKPSSAFSPLALTPDELGPAWDGGKLHLPLRSWLNGDPFGAPNAGVDMTFDFPRLIAHAAKTRPLAAGTIIGSGTVSNRLDGGPGKPIAEGGVGYSCIAEQRMIEKIETGEIRTSFMGYGDTIRIAIEDEDNCNLFGTIEQTIVKYPQSP